MLGALSQSDFTLHLGSRFQMQPASGSTFDVELVEVTGGRPGPSGDDANTSVRKPFSLVFRGPLDCHLPQGIHTVLHDTLGKLELFLVPIGPDREGMRFETVFN